ncbi:A/G-specific adenine glycosylase [Parafrigoribacterium mesophilum]|uniref:A/G-specific adenine glycosylase n=1 Tax=Parafrigoribacterium mesophilum TaxID=433646 RepID=UPI0031FCE591
MHIDSLVTDWFADAARDLPWRRPEFSPWGILVSEVMLQQTPALRVIDPLAQWLRRWPSPTDLAAEPAGEAVRAWGRLGYPRRALRLHACAVAIVERHGGVVPDSIEDLLALPGIGDYTARAVAAFAYGTRCPVVDTNVRRVLARAIGGQEQPAPPSTARDLAAMAALLPEDPPAAQRFNAGMMELGALVCTASSPRCQACPIAGLCAWRQAGYPQYTGARRAVQKRYEGSDRQVRGIILHELRAVERAVPGVDLEALWPDAAQRDRALAGLVADGLAVPVGDGYRLP